ncbi:Hypothetical protein SRAE_1000020100 [Strongyloides ratti]|uniref:Uncharacterized protein n=1 Tax=Strongyloides ratti TaxID=34506 RepID=A0A090KWN8_STRRB|nr:Hypothetical protein SRAE_1000020100 [Strongyloides ratti]CEF61925.1 Hypothetical protein SRAE_1000020100 [Strongyloides ratti]
MPQPEIIILSKTIYFIIIILFYLTNLNLSQETLYNLPPLPDEENHYLLNPPIISSTKKIPLSTNNNNIPSQQLSLFRQPLGQLLQFPLPQVPLFDRYNEANMKSELPPLPEESLKGYYDSDGMFVPNQPKEKEQNKTQILLPKNQMAAAATFVSVNDNNNNNNNNNNNEEDIPEDIFPEPLKKEGNNNQRDSIEKDFIISKSNLFIDGFGSENNEDEEAENDTESTKISHITPRIVENHGDLSLSKFVPNNVGEQNKKNFEGFNRTRVPPSTIDVTIAPIGLEKQFQDSFMTTIKRKFTKTGVSPLTQQFVRTTLSPKLVLRNQIKNTLPQYKNFNTGNGIVPNFRKHASELLIQSNNNIHNNAFLKKRPSSQSQFDLPLPAVNEKNNQIKKENTVSDKRTGLNEQQFNNRISKKIPKNNNMINEESIMMKHNERKNHLTIPPVSNPSIPNEENPSNNIKKKSKVPGKLNLPQLVSLPSPIINRLGNGEEQKKNNFVRNGFITQQIKNRTPKTVIRTSQIDVRNPTDSMFTNDLDWFDWEMYQNGRSLGFIPPNLINNPILPKPIASNIPDNRGKLLQQQPPIAIKPGTSFSRSNLWGNVNNQQPRASGAQQLPIQVQAAPEDIPPDSVVLTNPPQLELNIPGYTKQTPLPEIPQTNINQLTNEKLVPFENTNTGRVPASQLTTGLPYQNSYNNNYNNRNFYNTKNNNYNRQWNNNNNNNNYNKNYYQQSQNNQQPLFNLFNVNPFAGFNLFG